ncbi:restriction endonuclease subunit S [Aggregatibacter actinomycetemcomitans]|uniref:restriction endonuclease subunit S n=1 Tax=Aggregatibacter actinomycetemcomitans TaxID=714 RepID=UPI00077EC93D
MSNWKTYKLRNLVSFSQGIQIPLEEQFSIQHQDTGRFIRIVDYTNPNEEFRFIKNRDIKYWVNEKNIVMIRYGWAGKVVRGISGYIANNMFRIIVNNEQILNKEFLYYFLLQERIYKYLISCNSSTTMPSIKFSDFDNIDINLPSLEKQNTIVEKLNSFETKFKLNTQINQTLEQIAQAIFKSWFVDFDPVRAKAAALESGKTQAEAELAAMQAISGKTTEELAQMPSESYAELAEIAKAFPSGFGEDGVPMGWENCTFGDVAECLDSKRIPLSKQQREKRKGTFPIMVQLP